MRNGKKKCYLLCHSLLHILQDLGQASIPTWEPLGTIPAPVSLHPSGTSTIPPWLEAFSVSCNLTPQPKFNCLRQRPQPGIYLSDLAGAQSTFGWLITADYPKVSLPFKNSCFLFVQTTTKNRTTIWPSNPTTGHTPWENDNSKRYMYHNVHCSTIYSSQDMEAT